VGTERKTIEFRAKSPGRLSHRVRVTGSDGSVAEAVGSVDVIEGPQVELEVNGPAQLTAGGLATYIISVRNTGRTTLSDVNVYYRLEEDLFPNQATGGFEATTDPRVLRWTVQPMPPATAVTVTLELLANPNARKETARNRVVVTADGGVEETRDIDVRIVPPARAPGNPPPGGGNAGGGNAGGIGQVRTGRMVSTIKALTIEPRVGEPIEYVVTVKNNSSQPHRNLIVTIQLDENMEYSAATRGPDGTRPVQNANGVLQFSPVAYLRSTETISYQVSAISKVAGELIVSARIDADDADTARIRERVTVSR
jgi:uncharacterized repeat protein (TIGR01451 family)